MDGERTSKTPKNRQIAKPPPQWQQSQDSTAPTSAKKQIDHITPIAKGGGSETENLRILCRNHNLSEARKWGLERRSQ